MSTATPELAFPKLSPAELDGVRRLASVEVLADGATVFSAGDAEIDLFVVESGSLEIQNPTDENRVVRTHQEREFAGDIDLITGRPVLVTAIARGETTVLRVPRRRMRELLNRLPTFGEKLMIAFTARRELLSQSRLIGMRVVGAGSCKDTNLVREFLYKNFVPFVWFDPDTDEGRETLAEFGDPKKLPLVVCNDGSVLLNPTLRELAHCAGVWSTCPDQTVDLAIIGAGPAGLAAAVYAASEGISTILLDRVGPGGQAGGSSMIENFIGFPAGLSGAELAMRGVLQLLKFGARIYAPVSVERLEVSQEPGAPKLLHLDCGVEVRARVVLVAGGVSWRRLPAQGAERYESAGVHYACTSVEAHLYDGRDVAVVGAGNSAGQAVMYLSECCPTRRVHMVIRKQLGPGMSEYLQKRIRSAPNVVVHEETEISSVSGSQGIESVTLQRASGSEPETLPCAAVFVFIGADPCTDWLPPEMARDNNGYILTGTDVMRSGRWSLPDRDPCPLESSLPGILMAGDIRSGSTKRVGFAVGDGSLAVTCVHRLLTLGH